MKYTYQNIDTNDIKETNTQGKHAYVIALCCGGLMEDPDFHYHNFQMIRADTEYEAVEKYNELNNCGYFYGRVMSRIE